MQNGNALVAAVRLAAALFAAAPLFAHDNPRGEARLTLAGKTVAIDYGRPSLRGRDMLGRAQVGQVWMMGADAPTRLNSQADLTFGASAVPKGTYILRAKRLSESEWQLLLIQSQEIVAKVALIASPISESIETLTIELAPAKDGGELRVAWGTTSLNAGFTAK